MGTARTLKSSALRRGRSGGGAVEDWRHRRPLAAGGAVEDRGHAPSLQSRDADRDHSGSFHADEVFAIAALGLLGATIEVVPTREHHPVTLLAGDNGSGKSTVLDALAEAIGFAAEGGELERSGELPAVPRKVLDEALAPPAHHLETAKWLLPARRELLVANKRASPTWPTTRHWLSRPSSSRARAWPVISRRDCGLIADTATNRRVLLQSLIVAKRERRTGTP